MDSIKDLLLQKNLDEPSEITALKNYCSEFYQFEPKVSVTTKAIYLSVPNGILATEIRMRLPDIQRRCQLTRKLVIRIG